MSRIQRIVEQREYGASGQSPSGAAKEEHMAHTIKIYTTPACAHCREAKRYFT